MLMTWLADVRHALRRFGRQPLFAIVATLTLAVGIGANVTIFGFVNQYLLARMPVPAPDDLVRVYELRSGRYDIGSYPNYRDLRDGDIGLDLAAHVITQVALGAGETAEPRRAELVTGNYFRVMRMMPLAGRLLDVRDDEAEGAHAVVAIGEGLWRSRFNADPAIVGQSIRLNDEPYEVVGVVPGTFHGSGGMTTADLWAPLAMQQQLRPRNQKLANRGWGFLSMIGRLSPGATLATVKAGLDRVGADLNRQYATQYGAQTLAAVPARTVPEGDRRKLAPYLYMTIAFTTLLLVVTCANLAGVMQARVIARRRELAIRQSLGAARWRVASEWLTECVLLAGAGGLTGMIVARLAMAAVLRSRPVLQLVGHNSLDAPIDWRVATFAGGISLAAALLFGLMPALRAASAQPVSLLKEEATTSTGGRSGSALRRSAVLLQVAVSTTLLLASALLVTSLRNLQQFDLGFRTDHLAMVTVDLKFRRVPAGQFGPYISELLTRARGLTGVASVAVAADVPLGGGQDGYGYRIPGYTPPSGKSLVSIDTNIVSAGYFETMGLTFTSGGAWSAAAPARVAVINQTMASRFWPGRDPVGQPLEFIGQGMLTVAGVVRDSTNYDIGESPMPYAYLPAEIVPQSVFVLVARTTEPPAARVAALADVVRAVDARARALGATTFEEAREVPLYPQRMLATTAMLFGIFALVLTSIGLYGVVSQSVGQRTREIGVRVALGARPAAIQYDVLKQALLLVGLGAVAGLGVGYALAGGLRQWLFGVRPFDAAIYLGVAIVLGGVALVAAWIPARHAARIDPIQALRN